MLRIYNTLAREKQPFTPINPGKVGMYVCGMTIYDYCHLGHGRMLLAWDVIVRWLRASGYAVTYVRNITDVDDKIIKRAVENGEPISALTNRMTQAMHEDTDALGCTRPDVEPRATGFISQMLDLIKTLEDKGLAYQGGDGDMNFAVRKFEGYGKLSGKSLDELRAGERIAVDDSKRDPLDFALWKASKPGEPPEASWDSPFGRGRPGWHIECSAMARGVLGQPFDIHGGGPDLPFPHHENEIAQSEGAYGTALANIWMHNGPLRLGAEKMSKSLGNFFTIRDILQQHDAEVVRFFLVRTHYRSAIAYGPEVFDDARAGLTRLYTALSEVQPDSQPLDWAEPFAARFKAAMDDDFNTALAVAAMFDLATEINRSKDTPQAPVLARQLVQLGKVLGLLQRAPQAFLQGSSASAGGLNDDEIQSLIEQRAQAKQQKQFAQADAIRKQLLDQGIVLEDKPGGATQWRRA